MKVFNEKDNVTIDFDLSTIEKKTGIGLLEKLKININTILFIKNNEVVLVDEEISDLDEIKLLSVVSGG